MQLDLTRIRQPETAVSRRFEASEFEGRDHPFRIVAPIELQFTVYKDKTRYRLAGTMSTRLELACSRCLESFPQDVETSFDLRYLPATEATGNEEVEVEDDDLNAAFYRDDVIDLGQLVDEQIYLTLPMKPLCSDGCKGLCAQCGANRNLSNCGCETEWRDPRLDALRNLAARH